MANPHQPDSKELLYLDDLHVGQRFSSGTHLLDEAQITAFARQFDPQPFHLDAEAAKETLFGGLVASGWHTGRPSPCGSSWPAYRLAAGLLGPAENSPGRRQRGLVRLFMSRARSLN
jgi:hypothetical protein